MKVRILGAAACLLLLLPMAAGCGNGDDDKAAKALSKSLRSDGNDLGLSKKDADCVSEKMVDKVGTDDLIKYKILTKDLKARDNVDNVKMSSSDAKGAADAMMDCIDAKELMTSAMGDSLDAKTKACVEKAVTEDNIRAFLVGLFEGDQEKASKNLITPMMKCATQGSSQ